MRLILTTGLMLALGGAVALAQTSGGGGAPSGGAPSGGAPSGGAPSGAAPSGSAPAAPSAAPSPGAPATPGNPAVIQPGGAPRTNTEVFPPSRNLQSPAPRATAPGGLSEPGATNPSAGASTPGAPKAGTSQPQASGGGRPQPGGANSSAQSKDNRTGKNALNEEYADCMKLWDAGTHMTKQEWSSTCRRIQSRLNQVQIK